MKLWCVLWLLRLLLRLLCLRSRLLLLLPPLLRLLLLLLLRVNWPSWRATSELASLHWDTTERTRTCL